MPKILARPKQSFLCDDQPHPDHEDYILEISFFEDYVDFDELDALDLMDELSELEHEGVKYFIEQKVH